MFLMFKKRIARCKLRIQREKKQELQDVNLEFRKKSKLLVELRIQRKKIRIAKFKLFLMFRKTRFFFQKKVKIVTWSQNSEEAPDSEIKSQNCEIKGHNDFFFYYVEKTCFHTKQLHNSTINVKRHTGLNQHEGE